MAKKVERWRAANGQEFETEAECQDYEEMMAYAPEIIDVLLKVPGLVKDATYIVDSLWEEGYKVVKREGVQRG